MGATLDALHRLQIIENKLRALRGQIESKRRTVEGRRKRVAKLERDIAETHHAIQQAQSEADRFELDRRTREEHLAKLREALNRTRNNKEYAAILTELNTEKVDIVKVEDSALAALTRVDEMRKKQAELDKNLQAEQARVAEMNKQVEDVEVKLGADLTQWQSKREEACAEISPSVLSLFERACERHEGDAMAMLEKVHPKRAEYVCGGCNMSIPLEVVNALQSRDDVHQCQTCSRILYLEAPAGVGV